MRALLIALIGALPALADVDPALVGKWETEVHSGDGQTFPATLEIDSSDAYELAFVIEDGGRVSASDGKYETESTAGRSSEGTYAPVGQGRMTVTDSSGSTEWTRAEERPTGDGTVDPEPRWRAVRER